ncbi:hypothetical protein ETD83_02390 [Actinomadura soli]|uniref:Dynamin family protein n=1 Tax=Actinomadura soli TaxID=2508997 RepID=A0A5C4JJ70_9ACTN|nr:hypothetical protein [Actinomadura soli]TMR07008.1 hypothetical protein ETD83_02390 [Actinomadura soli]
MHGVGDRINAVIEARRAQVPVIEREISQWERVLRMLDDLAATIRECEAAEEGQAAADALAGMDVAALSAQAAGALGALTAVRAKVGRRTVNIGVSGRARNGKSTLLQSLSGLSDEQIPTGRGQPVTAVRSRIHHSVSRADAQLTMHSEQSFCDEVLGPYHAVLGLSSGPRSLDEFAAHLVGDGTENGMPDESRENGLRGHPQFAPMLARLREMRESLGTFRGHLTGGVRQADLADLRGWVSYPPPDDGSGAAPDRRYLAVRDVLIHCPFPIEDVVALGLVDLPGLGELVPHAEEHHLAGLENEVDFVLMVKRPTDTGALWSVEDAQALELVRRAGGAVAVRDFMAIVVNTGGCDQVNIDALNADIDKRLNEGVQGRFHNVINVDGADRAEVRTRVLAGVLDHLATALPRMDAASIGRALEVGAAARRDVLAAVEDALARLRSIMTPTATEELIARAEALRLEVAESLQAWVDELRRRADEGYEDEEFHARVTEVADDVRAWILDGFGEGEEAWTGRALGQMRLHKSSASFAEGALNGIRVEVSRRFSAIDDLLARRRERFWGELIDALGPRLGRLLEGDDPQRALQGLAERFRESPEPCPVLGESLDLVLDVRLDYRTRVLPKVRRALEVLLPQSRGDAAELAAMLAVPRTPEGAAELFVAVSQLARQAAYDAGKVLAGEPNVSAAVLHAYGEQFEDTFIRSAASETEFRRIAEAFRDQLWDEHAAGAATATARVQRVRVALTRLRQTLRDPATSTQAVTTTHGTATITHGGTQG